MNLEECIKDLDPELREKAHACGSEDELRSFLENEAIPIPDEALSAVAGGAGDDSKVGDYCDRCPKCGRRCPPAVAAGFPSSRTPAV